MKTDMHSWKGLKVVGHKTFLGEAKSYQASIDAMLGTGVKVEHGVNFEDISILTLEEESSCNTAHRKEADWKKEEKISQPKKVIYNRLPKYPPDPSTPDANANDSNLPLNSHPPKIIYKPCQNILQTTPNLTPK